MMVIQGRTSLLGIVFFIRLRNGVGTGTIGIAVRPSPRAMTRFPGGLAKMAGEQSQLKPRLISYPGSPGRGPRVTVWECDGQA